MSRVVNALAMRSSISSQAAALTSPAASSAAASPDVAVQDELVADVPRREEVQQERALDKVNTLAADGESVSNTESVAAS